MPAQKYTDIRVSSSINVSSTCSYTAHIWFRAHGKSGGCDYWVDGGQFIGERFGTGSFPRYFRREVERQLADLLASPTTCFYEHDRDGNRRTEGLRYYDAKQVASMAATYAQRAKAEAT